MIRVREFADQVGCSPQNIYLHLKNYATELEGHLHQGRRGTMLDEYAQDFIRSVMYPKEISADDRVTALQNELNQLRASLLQSAQENARLSALVVKVETERDKALFESGSHQKALLALQQSERDKEDEIAKLKTELEVEKRLEEKYQKDAEEQALLAKQQEEEKEKAKKEAREAEDKRHLTEQENAQLKAKLEMESNRPLTFKERLLGRKQK